MITILVFFGELLTECKTTLARIRRWETRCLFRIKVFCKCRRPSYAEHVYWRQNCTSLKKWVVASALIICELQEQSIYPLIFKNNGSDVCWKSIHNLYAITLIKNNRNFNFQLPGCTHLLEGGWKKMSSHKLKFLNNL